MKKYKLKKVAGKSDRYRLIALIDIPRHHIKKGDKGGYVDSGNILSHEGDCWIGGIADVMGDVTISGNVLVTDEAIVGAMQNPGDKGFFKEPPSIILSGDVIIRNQVSVFASEDIAMNISGETSLTGESIISNIPIIYDAVINGDGAEPLVIHAQDSIINRFIDSTGTGIRDKEFENRVNRLRSEGNPSVRRLLGAGAPYKAVTSNRTTPTNEGFRDAIADIEREYQAYTNDIVNLIKFPLMTDLNYGPTRDFVRALRKAKRALENNHADISVLVDTLEDKFLAAESDARRIALSQMDNTHREKISKAEKLISIACNSESSENEKRISYHQVFKQLEGIVFVSENAKESLKTMVGIKELEA